MIETPAWYVVRTKPHLERQVVHVLERNEVSSYLPLIEKEGSKPEPFFPGYVFVRVDRHDDYLKSRSAPGVSYFLLKESPPTPVNDEVVEEVVERIKRINVGRALMFSLRERVRNNSGLPLGLDGAFDLTKTARHRSLAFLVATFGPLATAELSTRELLLVNSHLLR